MGGVEGENVQGGKNDRNPCNVLAAEKLINDDDDDNDDRDKIICTKSTDVAGKARPLRLRYDFFSTYRDAMSSEFRIIKSYCYNYLSAVK